MIDTLFTEADWQIITSDFPSKNVFYARHDCEEPGMRCWMSKTEVVCTGCNDPVPDSIQVLITLLGWNY